MGNCREPGGHCRENAAVDRFKGLCDKICQRVPVSGGRTSCVFAP